MGNKYKTQQITLKLKKMTGLYWLSCPVRLCEISVCIYCGCLTVCLHQGHSTQQPWERRQGDNLEDSSAPGNQTHSAQSPWPWEGSLGPRSPCRWSGEAERQTKSGESEWWMCHGEPSVLICWEQTKPFKLRQIVPSRPQPPLACPLENHIKTTLFFCSL